MRTAFSLLLLMAVTTGCGRSGDTNLQQAAADGQGPAPAAAARDPLAVIGVAMTGGACAFTLNGRPATREALRTEGLALVQQVMRRPDGAAAMTDEDRPAARIEATADLPFDCAAFALGDLRSIGFTWVMLRVPGAPDQRISVFNNHDGPYTPRAIVQMGTGARIAWQEQEIDLPTLRQRAAALRRATSVPDDFVLLPAADTEFGAVHRAVGTVREAGLDLFLGGCAPEASTNPESRAVWGSERAVSLC
jgi:hypothetical protein